MRMLAAAVTVALLAEPASARKLKVNMPPGWSWPPNAAMIAEGRACLAHLDALGVKYRRGRPIKKVATPVILEDLTLAGVTLVPTFKKPPFTMDCALAAGLLDTAEIFASVGVTEVRFSEIWDYRSVNNQGRYLSRHALGLAIDVFAFVTADGVRHTVETDYPDTLLLTLEDWLRASLRYRMLTPGNDMRHHHDHFHLEVDVSYRPRSLAALAP